MMQKLAQVNEGLLSIILCLIVDNSLIMPAKRVESICSERGVMKFCIKNILKLEVTVCCGQHLY